jgi:hypothetical protein
LDIRLKTFEVSKDALLSKANSCSKLGGALLIAINPWGSSHEMLGITHAPGSMFSTINQQGMKWTELLLPSEILNPPKPHHHLS